MARGSIVKIISPTTGRISWRARWSFLDPSGIRRHRTETTPTRKEAEAVLTKAQHDLRSGTYVEPSRQPFGHYMTAWLSTLKRTSKRQSTYYHRAANWRRYGEPTLAAIPLGSLGVPQIQAVYDAMTDRGLAPGTVRAIHQVLRLALNDAITQGLIVRNVAALAKLPADRNPVPRHWSSAEAKRFLTDAAEGRDAALWTVMLHTGMRIGEALALRWSDVDLVAGTARIVRTVSLDPDGREIIVDGAKTASSVRTVPLVGPCVAILKRHRVTQNAQRLALGDRWHALDLVFPGPKGGAARRNAAGERFGRARVRLDLPPLSPHGLRHTAASLALEAGANMKVVQELLGHKSIGMTLDLYSHLAPGMIRTAAEQIADMLDPDNATTSTDETGGNAGSASEPRQTG